ncbi:MAG: helix-turn-helix domain-containing protein [Catenulispora sp.]|nr:helix-turn-helix domain-containing protein [Catenulispora sp.]NUS29167.1 helix-turn-helix domain-containing protein [Streptomyces sp.]
MPAPDTLPPPQGYLWLNQAAGRLGVKPSTLRKWRLQRRGPASFKHAGKVIYRETAIQEYLDGCEASDSRSNPDLNPLLRPPQPRISGRRTAAA